MITSAQYTITSTASKIAESTVGSKTVQLHVEGNDSIAVGPAGVTLTTGLVIDKDCHVQAFRLAAGDALYAITGDNNVTVTVIITE